ncbi:unnamed protein product [Protopolystoma xenopodis]|uniref:Uncharacterized protein n=1 Tax=Protopolystoma xenopodis TaxID=117903 RepID=A0A3S5BCJ8_9PLAT|nr:unnamed protein product [Protopolystoma xenopodis]
MAASSIRASCLLSRQWNMQRNTHLTLWRYQALVNHADRAFGVFLYAQKLGSGGIRTHAPEETGALIQRLRPLGHATIYL